MPFSIFKLFRDIKIIIIFNSFEKTLNPFIKAQMNLEGPYVSPFPHSYSLNSLFAWQSEALPILAGATTKRPVIPTVVIRESMCLPNHPMYCLLNKNDDVIRCPPSSMMGIVSYVKASYVLCMYKRAADET
jgi:hypothetical protein